MKLKNFDCFRYLILGLIIIAFVRLYFIQSSKVYSHSFFVHKFSYKAGLAPQIEDQFITQGASKSVHSATFAQINQNRLKAVWFGGSKEGAKDVSIFSAEYSLSDNKWSKEKSLVDVFFTQTHLKRYIKKLGNPVLFMDKDKVLWLFYVSVSVGGWSGSSINMMKSFDEGKRWSVPKRLISSPFLNVSTLVKGAPFQYQDGTIGLPVYHESMGKFAELIRIDQEGNVIFKQRLSKGRSFIAPVIVPLSPDRAICFFRYCARWNRRVHLTKTKNGGKSWTRPKNIDLLNHNSAFSTILSDDNDLLMVLNNSKRRRDSLSLAVSKDEGLSWKVVCLFEKEITEEHGFEYEFSYPSLMQVNNGQYHLIYTWHREQIKHIQFNKAWLKDKVC